MIDLFHRSGVYSELQAFICESATCKIHQHIVINDIKKATHQGYQAINLSELSSSLVDLDYVHH